MSVFTTAGQMRRGLGFLALALLAGASPTPADQPETRRLTATVDGQRFQIFSYRPRGCATPSILMVFHGNSRTAQSYRDAAIPLADRACFVVYAPLFDRDRFPNWSYHRGGLVDDGELRPEDNWTVELAGELLDWARAQEGRPDAPGYLFGHSAGGQFLSRVAAYALPEDVDRIILANPSTYVIPTRQEAAPYGFGGLPADEVDAWLPDYLAAPVTIYLGEEDTGSEDLTMTDAAVSQGSNRVDRGERTFETARQIAAQNAWPFNWRLVHADDVGHSARGMLGADEMVNALGF